MRGISKIALFVIFIFAISFYVISSNAMDIDKNYDASTKTVTITNHGTSLIDIQLISNTEQCLVYCEAIIRIKPYSDITIQSGDQQFVWKFIKSNLIQSDLKSYSFEILQDIQYNVTDYLTMCNPYNETLSNSTILINENCTKVETGQHIEYKQTYIPFDYYGYSFVSGKNYYIKLKGQKEISNLENNIDWVPTFYGIYIDNWAWWNSSWNNCRNLEVIEKSGKTIYNKPIEFNFTGLVKQSNNSDFRIVNASCYHGGIEQPYQIISSTSDSVLAVFQINLTANMSTNWSIYYNNSAAPNPGYQPIITFRDDFESVNISGYWNISKNSGTNPATSANYSKYGNMSLKILVDGGKFNSIRHEYGSIGAYGTINMWARESGLTDTYQTPFWYKNIDAGEYASIARANDTTTCSGCTKYSYRNNSDRQQSGIPFVSAGAWANYVSVTNTTGSYLYVQNISILNTTLASGFGVIYVWGDNVVQTFYVDEFRFYQNVYDDPSQQYNITTGNTYNINTNFTDRITFDFGDYLEYDKTNDKFKFFIDDQQVFCINKTGGYGNTC